MGVHRLFGNNLNVVKDANLTPSSVKPSSAIFPTAVKRAGSGTAMLVGTYTGADDTTFELRISAVEGVGRITQPVFIGVGTGVLSGLSAKGLKAQDFTIKLDNLGIDTLNAELDLGSVSLRALVSGTAGNNILVSVDESELVFTESKFATLESIAKGASEFTGPQWDWNTVVLNPRGEIPANGLRLKFENDPQIYRQYKIRVGSDWKYYLSPAVVRDIPVGSKVFTVSGFRRVIITDGTTVEQYSHVKTLYDFVSQVQGASVLVEVVGIIADDKTPGGMNCQDFPFTTSAYLHPIKMSGSKYVQRLDNIELQDAVNTEIIDIECIGNAEMGNEAWSVKGSVTGKLPGVRTAEDYMYGPVHFTIPSMLIDYQEPVGDMGLTVNYVDRDETKKEKIPPICLENRVLGVKAKTGSVTFTWTENISLEGCNCESASLSGVVSAECLGLKDLGGDTDLVKLDTDYKSRLDALYSYIDEYTQDNTYFYNEVNHRGWEVRATLTKTYSGGNWDGKSAGSQPVVYSFEDKYYADKKAAELMSYSKRVYFCCNEVYVFYTYEDVSVVHVYNYVGGAEADLKFMHSAMSILSGTLVQIYKVPGALVIWDSLLNEVEFDLNSFRGSAYTSDPGNNVRNILGYGKEFLERYQAKANLALLAAGIVPGKKHSSNESAGCWSQRDDAYYWKASDNYLPAYNNVVYHSAKLNVDGKAYSTKEFAFTIVCACSQYLKAGDQVTVNFDAAGNQVNTYQLGDKFSIPIIGAKDLALSGGVDGNDTLTWKVIGSKVGQLPDYLLVSGAEETYNQNGLSFLIERGGIPFELGDQWAFSAKGGKFRWKKDSGAWSSELDITSQALSDGVSVMFTDGPAPSFTAGDLFQFEVLQPNSAENVKAPTSEHWTWNESSPSLLIDFGGEVHISEIFVADHNIPNSSMVLIEGSHDGFISTDWSYSMVWNEAVLSKVLTAVVTVTHLRLVISNADCCSIGWICAGVGLTTELSPALSLRRQYAAITGGSVLAGGSISMGSGWGGQLSWENSMSQDELTSLITLLDYLKENGNEPVIMLPHIMHEKEAKLCRIDAESVEINDVFNYQPDEEEKRVLSVVVPLEPVYL